METEIKENSEDQLQEIPNTVKKEERFLKPVDCAHLMSAFCKVKLFEHNLDLFELLQRQFVKYIDHASGETLVTMYTSHANWGMYMIEECLVKKS